MPDGHMMTAAFMIGLTTRDLKDHFANELRVPLDFIKITQNGDHTLLSTVIYLNICKYICTNTTCANWIGSEMYEFYINTCNLLLFGCQVIL